MVSARDRVLQIRQNVSNLEKQLKDRIRAKNIELGGRGRFNVGRDETARNLSLKIDLARRNLRTATTVEKEFVGATEKQQALIFGARQSARERGIALQRVESRAREAQTKQQAQSLKLKAKPFGLEPINIRGVQKFRDVKTKRILSLSQLKARTLPPVKRRATITPTSEITTKTFNVLSAPQVPKDLKLTRSQILGIKGLNKNQLRFLSEELRKERLKIQTQKFREKGFRKKEGFKISKVEREIKIAGLSLGIIASDIILSVKSIPSAIPKASKAIIELIKDPPAKKEVIQKITKIPSAIDRKGEEIGRMLRVSPTELLVEVAGQVLVLKGSGKAFEVIGRVSPTIKITPKLKKIKDSNVILAGTQKQVGDKIITNIIFKTDKNIVGKARGVTVQKGKESLTFTLGKSQKLKKGKDPTQKEVFIGFEKGISKISRLKLEKEISGVGTVIQNLEGIFVIF